MLTICARCGWAIHQDFGWVDEYGYTECGGKPHVPSKVVTNSLSKSA